MNTHTYAVMLVSKAVYDEVRRKLLAAGYGHQVTEGVLNMHGIALQAETDEVQAAAERGAEGLRG